MHYITHNSHFIVKNLNGSTSHRRPNESWITYYRRESGSQREICAVLGCSNPVEVGAHVWITDKRSSNTRYIAPFCKKCNHPSKREPFALKRNTILVIATIK